MNDSELKKIRHNILEAVKDKMTDELIPANLNEEDESGAEVLAVVIEDSSVEGYDALGEFFFIPAKDDDEIHFFTSHITVSEELYEKTINELCVAVSTINTYTPAEGFAIDFGMKNLIFRHTLALPAGMDEKTMHENVELSMVCALDTVAEYGYMLSQVNDGTRTAQSVIGLFAKTGE